jgi:NitT/TauT family transport system substrate-binding protein
MKFSEEAADLLLQIGIIKKKPDLTTIVDTSFIK